MRQAGDCQEVTATVGRYGKSYTASSPVSSGAKIHLWEDQLKLPVPLWSARIAHGHAVGHLKGNIFQRERVRTRTGYLSRSRNVQLARNTGWPTGREP
jgi:hypothetical protein